MRKTLSLLLAAVLALTPALCLAEAADDAVREEPQYVYKDAVSALPACWNPHTGGDEYPGSLLGGGLYAFFFNDALHPMEGAEPFSGCVAVPDMAAGEPVDVTGQVRKEHPELNIPADAAGGYAYAIDLNPACTWEDGAPINADTYVYSMMMLLNPGLQNARAADFYAGDLRIAGAEAYAKGGRTEKADNGVSGQYTMESLIKDENGLYRTAEGFPVCLAVDFPLDWTLGYTLKNYVDAYGEAYFSMEDWEALAGEADENGLVPLTDESLARLVSVISGNPAWGENEGDAPRYFIVEKTRPQAGFDTVGLYKTGDYQITLALEKPLTAQALMRALTRGWLIKQALYEADPAAYCTGVETTPSCGPYKLAAYEPGQRMRFTRNEAWFGYRDGKHVYADPAGRETRGMYMSDAVELRAVPEAADRLQMFLRGELTEYALQGEDFAAYRRSDRIRFIPAETVYFLALNGDADAIGEREEAQGFDTAKYDLQTLTLQSFRKALFLALDREAFAAGLSSGRMACWGLIGSAYLYDAEAGLRYRDAAPAEQALAAAYGGVPDTAGLKAAKAFFRAAYREALAAQYITDTNQDGRCDQTIQLEYAADADSAFLNRVVECLNEQLAEATKDTPFRGRVTVTLSQPCGDAWSARMREGRSDAVLMGWRGDASDPYALMTYYVNPAYTLNGQWADVDGEELTVTVGGEALTASLMDWCDALNGRTITIGETEYSFGEGQADAETRLMLLAALEKAVLCGYDAIPLVQDAAAFLLSRQIDHVTEQYHPILGFGGLMYGRYNYDEAAWAEYVKAQPGGTVAY